MRDAAILLIRLLTTVARLLRPAGVRSLVAESLLLRQQLLILNRGRERAPNLNPVDRLIAALCCGWIGSIRLRRVAIVLKPATLLAFHRALVKRKYRLLFSPKRRGVPGPKGPSAEVVAAILAMKQRNPRFGCRRIAQQLSYAFGLDLDKDLVRRVLAQHYRPESGGPSWLTFLGHTKDSLWSVDLVRCESLLVKTHWVMVVMDQCTRRIIGFAVQAGVLDGPSVCRMLNQILSDAKQSPHLLSSDHDPLFEFHRWKANLRILEIEEVKNSPLRPVNPSVHRAADRHAAARVLGSRPVLDRAGPRAETPVLQGVLQPGADSLLVGRSNTNSESRKFRAPTAPSRAVSLAIALPRALPSAGSGLNWNSPQTRRGRRDGCIIVEARP